MSPASEPILVRYERVMCPSDGERFDGRNSTGRHVQQPVDEAGVPRRSTCHRARPKCLDEHAVIGERHVGRVAGGEGVAVAGQRKVGRPLHDLEHSVPDPVIAGLGVRGQGRYRLFVGRADRLLVRQNEGHALRGEEVGCFGPMPRRCLRVARGSRDSCRGQLGQGAVESRIGRFGDHDRFGDEASGVVVTALMGSDLCEGGSARHCGLEVLAGRSERTGSELVGIGDAPLEEQRAGEQGGGLTGICTDAESAEAISCGTQVWFGGYRIAREEICQSREQLGLVERVPEAELASHGPRGREFLPCGIVAPAEGLEHPLAADGGGFDGRRRGRDAQEAEDVETPAARSGDRARPPQCGQRRGTEHGNSAAPIAGRAGGAECQVELGLAVTDASESRQTTGTDEPSLGHTSVVAELDEAVGRVGGQLAGLGESVGGGQRPQLRPETARPRCEPGVRGSCLELVDEWSATRHVGGGEQRFAADQQQLVTLRPGVCADQVECTDRCAARRRKVFSAECLFGRRTETGRGLDGEAAGPIIDRAEFGSVPVHLLEMVGNDHVAFVLGDAGRFDVTADSLVELGPMALQQAPVRGVADQHVMEPVHRVIACPLAGRLDEVLAPQSVDDGTEPRGDVASRDRGERPAVELGTDHRRQFDHLALVVGKTLDSAGQQRQDRRRHLDRVGVDRQSPPVTVACEHAVVDEHLDELAHEQRIAVGRLGETFGELDRELVDAQQQRSELERRVGVETFERN